jgi:hypothetical protein
MVIIQQLGIVVSCLWDNGMVKIPGPEGHALISSKGDGVNCQRRRWP